MQIKFYINAVKLVHKKKVWIWIWMNSVHYLFFFFKLFNCADDENATVLVQTQYRTDGHATRVGKNKKQRVLFSIYIAIASELAEKGKGKGSGKGKSAFNQLMLL